MTLLVVGPIEKKQKLIMDRDDIPGDMFEKKYIHEKKALGELNTNCYWKTDNE